MSMRQKTLIIRRDIKNEMSEAKARKKAVGTKSTASLMFENYLRLIEGNLVQVSGFII